VEEMTERDWQTFFSLLKKIVDMPRKTLADKIETVKAKAAENGGSAEENLEDFLAWDFEF
jgi:16S rRNA A1518/A1519 N6-dimethyltransferase RsmA/KsgA/DIM1 with predicted DNA glycosylase/AP lyase activity